jgi:hypothetical protein
MEVGARQVFGQGRVIVFCFVAFSGASSKRASRTEDACFFCSLGISIDCDLVSAKPIRRSALANHYFFLTLSLMAI